MHTSTDTSLHLTPLPEHFEADTHLGVVGASVASVRVISGETELEDITVVVYRGVPALSFYDVYGRLVDIDHYLPDGYTKYDERGAESILASLRVPDQQNLTDPSMFPVLLGEALKQGEGSLAAGLQRVYGLESSEITESTLLNGTDTEVYDLSAASSIRPEDFAGNRAAAAVMERLVQRYATMRELLLAYISTQVRVSNNYVHFTARNNIVITPLNKWSGVAVIIETHDDQGRVLRPSEWRITRTHSVPQLEKALVFRTEDIQYYFDADAPRPALTTERYSMLVYPNHLSLDSLLDDTSNVLTVPVHRACYQVLAADPNVIVALSDPRRVSIVNTHRSIVPKKWLDTIRLPEDAKWIRADENLGVLFALSPDGILVAYNVTGGEAKKLASLPGPYVSPFTLDRTGALTLVQGKDRGLRRVTTNVNDIELPGQAATFAAVFKNLSHLFRGESLFTKATYARPAVEQEIAAQDKLPTAVEVARFDFETNVDHLLAEAGEDYDQLLEVREKVSIARQNILEEFARFAEESGIRLVGHRLQQMIGNIVRPAERRLDSLIENLRAQQLLEEARKHSITLKNVTDPGAYRDVLNSVRAADDELRRMDPGNIGATLTEFLEIKEALNALFSKQITEDGNALRSFVTREIEKIEEAIAHAYEPRRLERILSTHPAALELFALLKQPFVLQSVAQEQQLSPAGIQSRLHGAVEARLTTLQEEARLKEAERTAAKVQLATMVRDSIDFFIQHHTGGFSDLELSRTASYQAILGDIDKIERIYDDTRLAGELRARLERVILDRNRRDLERNVAHEGRYAFVQNDPNLFVDLESTIRGFPTWSLELVEKSGTTDHYVVTFIRDTDREVYRPSTTDNLRRGRAFEIDAARVSDYLNAYQHYIAPEHPPELLGAVWEIASGAATAEEYPQFSPAVLSKLAPTSDGNKRALGAALEKKHRDQLERTRTRNVPEISSDFIDETPYFQSKLREFFIKAKLQLGTGAGILLLSGPPSTGKSAFLKFAAALMNREYFEHASDKWQTKNSLVTAIRFGENGPYTTPAGFTRAITTAHSLVNIEEIKEWPEALRKSLNPFFAGSKEFIAPDGTNYQIGENILLCGAANLGTMYRLEDEAFTADFWSRIEVVEYDYAPHTISENYFQKLHNPLPQAHLTMQDLVRDEFEITLTEGDPDRRARTISRKLLEFLVLPKADDRIKRERLTLEVNKFFDDVSPGEGIFGPEEAAKVALRRVKDLQGYSAAEFFDLYDHFINQQGLRSMSFQDMQSVDTKRYEHLRVIFLTLFYLEACLRHLRQVFRRTGGQTEIEGTNREFINAVYLLGLMGRLA